jgi:Holliday junction resolvase RusA-like endonuclease
MSEIKIVIPGEPKAKARPRVTRKGIAYTPKKTLEYENWVKECFVLCRHKKMLKGQIEAEIKAYFKIPKSASKKKKTEMIKGKMRPTKKPDTDNVAKIILDSLNDLAYSDDKQVIKLIVEKFYSEEPRVEVVLREIS